MSKRGPAPLIGITCEAVSKRKDFADYDLLCDHRYSLMVTQAGGHPVLLPIAHRRSLLHRYMEGIDGLVIVGGDDLDPRWYGERPKRATKIAFPKRSEFEAWLYRAGRQRKLPMLGICYGMQLINVLEGGTLYQHLSSSRMGHRVDHQGLRHGTHDVSILPRTRLANILGEGPVRVATEHHQGIRSLAEGFIPSAEAADGIIEAMETPAASELFAVQWHPERLPESQATRRLLHAFIRACSRYQRARSQQS
ncbi:MAG: gamma-glutamyl-gamma-aminobutyrate hydrolase family protein [Nitrospirales bacterium]|nr:gamma-glutamyl-gamma-aminobutyrate hydrolase family protein [Nitrospira sp.]MDR4502710.1 gamma-glutamyl-gamma-aminobutyrate hydrolase family protein [Nitrospirales bacterium]